MTWADLRQSIRALLNPYLRIEGDLHAIRDAIGALEYDQRELLSRQRRLEAQMKQHLADHHTENKRRANIAASVEKTLAGLEHDQAT